MIWSYIKMFFQNVCTILILLGILCLLGFIAAYGICYGLCWLCSTLGPIWILIILSAIGICIVAAIMTHNDVNSGLEQNMQREAINAALDKLCDFSLQRYVIDKNDFLRQDECFKNLLTIYKEQYGESDVTKDFEERYQEIISAIKDLPTE